MYDGCIGAIPCSHLFADWFSGGAQNADSLRIALAIAVLVAFGTSYFLWLAKRTFEQDLIVQPAAATA